MNHKTIALGLILILSVVEPLLALGNEHGHHLEHVHEEEYCTENHCTAVRVEG